MAVSRLARRIRRLLARAAERVARGPASDAARTRASNVVELERTRRRLELVLAATYGRLLPIAAADPPPQGGWMRRYVLGRAPREVASRALASNDGLRILLPRALDAAGGEDAALARYRLLALQQAERVVRGTAEAHPGDDDRLLRDLFLVCESAAVDDAIAARFPRERPLLDRLRAGALAARPSTFLSSPADLFVEQRIRATLAPAGTSVPVDVPRTSGADESLAWARETVAALGERADLHYLGVKPVAHWGVVHALPRERAVDPAALATAQRAMPRLLRGRRPEHYRSALVDDAGTGQRVEHESAAPETTRAPDDENGERSAGGGASDAEPTRAARPAAPPSADARDPWAGDPRRDDARRVPGIEYREWDHVTGSYRERAVTVHVSTAVAGDGAWAGDEMRANAAVVRAVRQRFERLRAHRLRLRQQPSGDELDLAAVVRAEVDRRMGQAPDHRLFVDVRAARHPLAIALLVDVSGSTRETVGDGRRMIDVEKTALLLASEALSALGDRYAVLTFCGSGAHDVRVATLKAFAERNDDTVRRRIAALAPDGTTRLGAAVRHATAVLAAEPARHRLLLVLSDGRPHDSGEYASEYGVEDSRQAINEARAAGVYPFCLNVDREGRDYLARIFGPAGYTTLRRPDQLPDALLRAVRTLVTS